MTGTSTTMSMAMPASTDATTGASTAAPTAGAFVMPIVNPPATDDPRFVAGTTGPEVAKGKAATVKVADGSTFNGGNGRKQNNDDKKQNNYSVTDANYNSSLGLLAKNPDTGAPLTYPEQEQLYDAAGYIQAFAPKVYAQLITNQNAGKGTILGAAGHLLGLVNTPDPAEAGLSAADIASVPQTIPGSPISAKAYMASGQDVTDQDWARMHHAESSWNVYNKLVSQGLDYKSAFIFSGDDAISGAGRLNGVNNQDGNASGMNNDEQAVFRLAAQTQAATGIPIIQDIMSGHHMDDLDPSAMTDPKINSIIGFPSDAMDFGTDRANAIANAFLNGTIGSDKGTLDQIHKFQFTNADLNDQAAVKAGTGAIDQFVQAGIAQAAVLDANAPHTHHTDTGGGGGTAANTDVTPAEATGAGTGTVAATPTVAPEASDATLAPATTGTLPAATADGASAVDSAMADMDATQQLLEAQNALGDIATGNADLGQGDATAVGKATTGTQAEQNRLQQTLVQALSDNRLSATETKSLMGSFTAKGKALLQSIVKGEKDGSISDADAQRLITEAGTEGAAKLKAALKDGTLTAAEIKGLTPFLNADQAALVAKIKPGATLTSAQRTAIEQAGAATPATAASTAAAAGPAATALDAALAKGPLTKADIATLDRTLSAAQKHVLDGLQPGDSLTQAQVDAAKAAAPASGPAASGDSAQSTPPADATGIPSSDAKQGVAGTPTDAKAGADAVTPTAAPQPPAAPTNTPNASSTGGARQVAQPPVPVPAPAADPADVRPVQPTSDAAAPVATPA